MKLLNKIFSRNAVLAGFVGVVLPWVVEVYLPTLQLRGGWIAVAATVATLVVNAIRAGMEEES